MYKNCLEMTEKALKNDSHNFRLFYFISFRITFNVKYTDEIVEYINKEVFPYQYIKNCINAVLLLYQTSLTVMSVKFFEKALNNETLIGHLSFFLTDIWTSKSMILQAKSYFYEKEDWNYLYEKILDLVQLWADATLMHQ